MGKKLTLPIKNGSALNKKRNSSKRWKSKDSISCPVGEKNVPVDTCSVIPLAWLKMFNDK